jgi:adenosylmethionine-8-amino-7-oxononanoate aminotransferase
MHFTRLRRPQILDGTAGLWCVNAGHCRPKITEGNPSRPASWTTHQPSRWATRRRSRWPTALADLAPDGMDHVLFTNSGSEAVETALKVALAYHRVKGDGSRFRLIGRERGYHGVNFGGISVGGIVTNRKMFGTLLTGVDHMPHTHASRRTPTPSASPSTAASWPTTSSASSRCMTLDRCRRHRRAGRRLHRRADAACRLSQAAARDLRPPRHPADLRRGHHRLRPASARLSARSISA